MCDDECVGSSSTGGRNLALWPLEALEGLGGELWDWVMSEETGVLFRNSKFEEQWWQGPLRPARRV